MKATLKKNGYYKASATLGPLETWIPNSMIEQQLKAKGFVGVTVTGTGAERKAQGVWSLDDQEIELPKQITSIESV